MARRGLRREVLWTPDGGNPDGLRALRVEHPTIQIPMADADSPPAA